MGAVSVRQDGGDEGESSLGEFGEPSGGDDGGDVVDDEDGGEVADDEDDDEVVVAAAPRKTVGGAWR